MPILHLAQKERKALQEFKNKLAEKFGSRLVLLQLFGSKARGDFHKESDLDVLVVIKDLKPKDRHWIAGLAMDISSTNNIFISQLVFPHSEWEIYQKKRFSLARNVEEEGVKI